MWKLWIIASGIFLILESITTGFLIFWFAIGCIFALVTSLITESIVAQTTVFIITSTISIFATRKLCNKFLQNNKPNTINTTVGKVGKVTVTINPIDGVGQVKVAGETWSAMSEKGEVIKEGTKVKVNSQAGVKVVVVPVED